MAPNLEQFRCISVGEWFSKRWHIHTLDGYSAIKKHELLIHITTGMNLQRIKLSDKNGDPKILYSVWQNYRNGEHIAGCQGLRKTGGGNEGSVAIKGSLRDPRGGDGNVLYLDCITISQLWGCIIIFQDSTPKGDCKQGIWVSLYYLWRLPVNLQLPPNKKINLKNLRFIS